MDVETEVDVVANVEGPPADGPADGIVVTPGAEDGAGPCEERGIVVAGGAEEVFVAFAFFDFFDSGNAIEEGSVPAGVNDIFRSAECISTDENNSPWKNIKIV